MGLRTIASVLEEAANEAAAYIRDLEDRIAMQEMELRAKDRTIEELEADTRGLALELAELRGNRADRGPRIVNG